MSLIELLKYPVIVGSALVLSYLLTPLVRHLAERLGVVDHPAARRINEAPVPRAGGLAVFVAFHFACALLFLVPWESPTILIDTGWWFRLLIASSMILVVGLADDVLSLSARTKLAGQTVAALAAFAMDMRFGGLFGFQMPFLLDLLATLLWILAITNAFNLIDGLDGLAAGLATIASVGLGGAMLFRQSAGDALIFFALAGACLGFLRYNFHPASIFLGDAGSLFLGFVLACLALGTGNQTTAVAALGVPLLAVGVPVLDTLLAVWRRSVRRVELERSGQKADGGLMTADMDHVHHRLLRSGLSQRGSAAVLYGIAAILVCIGLLVLVFQSRSAGIFLIAFLAGAYVMVKHLAQVELWDTGRMIVSGLTRPPDRALATVAYPVADVLILCSALLVGVVLGHPEYGVAGVLRAWRDAMPVWVGFPFLALLLTRVYERTWSRARLVDFTVMSGALAAGIALAVATNILFAGSGAARSMIQGLVEFGLAFPMLLATRNYHRVIEDLMAIADRRHMLGDRVRPRNVLLYGAGHRCMLYLRELGHRQGELPFLHLVGLLDDDRNLRKMLVFGYRVLGSIDELPEILEEHPIDEIIMTAHLDAAHRKRLFEIAEERQVSVSEWRSEKRVFLHSQAGAAAPRARGVARSPASATRSVPELSVEVKPDAVASGAKAGGPPGSERRR